MGWFGAATDMHEQRLALETLQARKEHMRQARDELDRRVRERTTELSKALASLEREEEVRKALLKRIVTVQEEERGRISRELHDQMSQHLAALMLRLKLLKDSFDSSPLREQLEQLEDYANCIGQEAHRIAFELRPTALDDLGIVAAIIHYAEEWTKRTGILAEVRSSGFERNAIPSAVTSTIYRVVQEAMTNVLKHAAATRVIITINLLKDYVFLIVEDNGTGFDEQHVMNSTPPRAKLGLLGMRERVSLAGGTLEIESSRSEGTILIVRIPVPEVTERSFNEQTTSPVS